MILEVLWSNEQKTDEKDSEIESITEIDIANLRKKERLMLKKRVAKPPANRQTI